MLIKGMLMKNINMMGSFHQEIPLNLFILLHIHPMILKRLPTGSRFLSLR